MLEPTCLLNTICLRIICYRKINFILYRNLALMKITCKCGRRIKTVNITYYKQVKGYGIVEINMRGSVSDIPVGGK